MKQSIGYVVSSIFIVFTVVLSVCLINVFSSINEAKSYHENMIADIQASNFSSSVISKYTNNDSNYDISIIDKTVDSGNDNIDKTGRIYEVTTKYKISIPVIGYSSVRTLQGYAR